MYVTSTKHISKMLIVYNELNCALGNTMCVLHKIAFYIGNIVECHDKNKVDGVNGQRLF